MLTQEDVELRMYAEGVERANTLFSTAEEKGRAAQTPYAQRLFREYVLPLAAILHAEVGDSKPARRRAYIALLHPLDLDTVAFLAVRHVLNTLLGPRPANHRTLGYSIGRTIHRELVLAQIEQELPELYHTLARDFSRRVSTDEAHRMAVFKMQAKKAGINWSEWTIGSRDQVGLYLLGKIEDIGLVELSTPRRIGYKHDYSSVTLTPPVLQVVDSVKHYLAETSPAYGPCVTEPVPWTGLTGGGFHTPQLRRVHRSLVKAAPTARELLRKEEMPIVLAAVNALQGTQWRVNQRILEAIVALAEAGREVCGVATPYDEPRPPRAAWMDTVEKADMTPEQAEELKAWKLEMMKWYERRKLRTNEYGRFYSTTRQAMQFVSEPVLHFVYFLDSRGRGYPMTHGMNPQGADMQRALLHFARGLPVHTEHAEKWFLVQGANKWGFDKAPLLERAQWSRDRHDQIMSFARAPLDNQGWTAAKSPLQFLAWCFEYHDWRTDSGFLSRLPISMDGSCSGLQHFSAMLRDQIGGEATNLTKNPVMQDIYARVAAAATVRMKAATAPDPEAYRARWLDHGIGRAVVKRAVMTTPYGVTHQSAVKYVVSDYLAAGEWPELGKKEYRAMATEVMRYAWPAIGDVVVAARQAMAWLKRTSVAILSEQLRMGAADPVIAWKTPSGFLATQCYFEFKLHQIRSHLHGDIRIRVAQEIDTPDIKRHASGMAPNFIHSMDAAHLHLTAAAASKAGIKDLAMIHDDFGTHAANSEKLFHIIREQFHYMYSNFKPLEELAEKYPAAPPPPESGTLDISEVLESEYFFS